MIEENIRSSLLPDHGRVALLLLDVDRIPFSHSGRVERNGGTSVGNRYLLSGMGEIAGAVERKIKKMGGRAWHVSTRKLGSTARRGASTIRKKVGWERELPWEERRKRRGRERVKKGGGEHPLRHLEVNGTAKVYFVAERTGCHATMAPWWGCNGPRGTKRATGKRDRVEAVRRSEEERERGRGKEGNIAAAAAAAAVAVSAPLRVTLEGAHRRTVAQATGAPVALKFSFFPLAERGIPRNIGGERQRSIERGEKTFQKWIIRRGVSFWEGSFCSVFVGTSPTRCLSDQR